MLRRIDARDAGSLQSGRVLQRNDAAADHRNIFGAVFFQSGNDVGHQRQVRARQDRQPDNVRALVRGRGGDAFGLRRMPS